MLDTAVFFVGMSYNNKSN